MSRDGGALMLLCRCLREEASPEAVADLKRRLAAGDVDWLGLAALANYHLVTPALHESLRRKGVLDALPNDFRLYLTEVRSRNAVRNRAIRRQAEEAITALNAAGVVPLVLKGGVSLLEDASEGDIRLLGDLDLLVQRPDFVRAEAVLRDLGYEAVGDHSHAKLFARAHVLATIDLHRDVGRQRLLVSVDDAWRAAAPLPLGPLRAVTLCPTHRVLLDVFHSQVHERSHVRGEIPLRRLYDFTVSAGRHSAEVDWSAVEAAMRGLGLGHGLRAWLYLAAQLLGMPLPLAAATWRAKLHLRRCLFQFRHPRLALAVHVASRLTERFARVNIDYVYGTYDSRSRHAYRLRRGLSALYRRGGWGLWNRIRDVAARADRETGP